MPDRQRHECDAPQAEGDATSSSASSGPRMSPVAPPYDDDTERLLAKWMPPEVEMEPLLLFRLLAVHRQLASRMHPMASGLSTTEHCLRVTGKC